MKHIIFVLFFVAMGFNCIAQGNKGLDSNEVNKVKKELVNQIINPMRKTADQLLRDINNAQALYDKLNDRKLLIVTSKQIGDSRLESYLEQISFNDLFDEIEDGGWLVKPDVLTMVNAEPESAIKTAYLVVIGMKESLCLPYDEDSNNMFIKGAVTVKDAILPSHKADFDQLVSQINDYNYYMFELARLFVAADEDNYSKTAEQLVEDEDAKYLLEVPYTSKMLRLYCQRRGQLNPEEKTELKNACSDAFPDF